MVALTETDSKDVRGYFDLNGSEFLWDGTVTIEGDGGPNEGLWLGPSRDNRNIRLSPSGDAWFQGDIAMEGNNILGLAEPTKDGHAATKGYVDDKVSESSGRNRIKILPSDFIQGQSPLTNKTYSEYDIPEGYKATGVYLYSNSDGVPLVSIYSGDITNDERTIIDGYTSKYQKGYPRGINVEGNPEFIDIQDVVGNSTNYIGVNFIIRDTGKEQSISGGYIQLEPVN